MQTQQRQSKGVVPAAELYTKDQYYIDIVKLEDKMYLNHRVRQEQFEKAIEKYGL